MSLYVYYFSYMHYLLQKIKGFRVYNSIIFDILSKIIISIFQDLFQLECFKYVNLISIKMKWVELFKNYIDWSKTDMQKLAYLNAHYELDYEDSKTNQE